MRRSAQLSRAQDTDFHEFVIDRVVPHREGWDVHFNGRAVLLKKSRCKVVPKSGQILRLYGAAAWVRGAVIGQNVYSYRTREQCSRSQREVKRQAKLLADTLNAPRFAGRQALVMLSAWGDVTAQRALTMSDGERSSAIRKGQMSDGVLSALCHRPSHKREHQAFAARALLRVRDLEHHTWLPGLGWGELQVKDLDRHKLPIGRYPELLDEAHALVFDARKRRKLRRYARALERAPDDRRALIAWAIGVLNFNYFMFPRARPKKTPLAEFAPIHVVANYILGLPNPEASALTRAERHEWLHQHGSLCAPSVDPYWLEPLTWLNRKAGFRSWHNSYAVVRWVTKQLDSPTRREALHRKRVTRDPDGVQVTGRYIDRIDELREADLTKSVDQTFRNASDRRARETREYMKRQSNPLAAVPSWWVESPHARLLLTPAELAMEGSIMKHCVAGYAGEVASKRSVIIGLNFEGHRSTVEVDRSTAEVQQHQGPGNTMPPDCLWHLLAGLVQQWRDRLKGRS